MSNKQIMKASMQRNMLDNKLYDVYTTCTCSGTKQNNKQLFKQAMQFEDAATLIKAINQD